MRKICISKRLLMKVIIFVMILSCNLGVGPSVISMQSSVAVTAEAATAGQRNALQKAKDYLNVMAFSKKGLIEQLKYDGYSTKEANYAVKYCGASWKKQAVKKAKDYLNVMAFSKKGLIEQLKFDGYSTQEANYAAKYCGASWKKQAVKKAKEYLNVMSFSKSGLIEQLEFDGFTESEAKYGVSKAYK